MAIRRLMRRFGGRGGVLLAVVVVSGALAMHHSVVVVFGDMHHDAGVGAAVELCLGVMAAGAAAVAVAIGIAGLGRSRPLEILGADRLAVAFSSRFPRVRAGPALLSQLCVRRR
jgi:hypothetical protein